MTTEDALRSELGWHKARLERLEAAARAALLLLDDEYDGAPDAGCGAWEPVIAGLEKALAR